jgi:hypothetical protein
MEMTAFYVNVYHKRSCVLHKSILFMVFKNFYRIEKENFFNIRDKKIIIKKLISSQIYNSRHY